jgi:hypothetical protein
MVDGHRMHVKDGGPGHPKDGVCTDPGCARPMKAARGGKVSWYWRHDKKNDHCETAGETEWHRAWKEHGLPDSQEKHVGNRWADVLAPGGYAVEFQRQPFKPPDKQQARENDWANQGGMVWIFYAIEAAKDSGDPDEPGARLCAHLPGEWCRRCADAHRPNERPADDRPFKRRRQRRFIWTRYDAMEREQERGRNWREADERAVEIIWRRVPEWVRSASPSVPTFLDLDGKQLVFVGGWRLSPEHGTGSATLTGYGWPVSRQWVIGNVLRGDKIPKPFGQDPEVILRPPCTRP